ncbi:MAG: ATP-grasp domain-containing protein [Candidatus Omnitrophica bacterium]|nr:ATP-grasp domain-containing protein [Candidatus Omnitrophota bacterium]
MKKDLIIIIGAGLFQIKAIREAKELGLTVLAVDRNDLAPGREHCDLFECVSTKDIPAIVTCVKKYTRTYNVRGIMTAGTDVAYSVACVADALGLPGISVDAAFCATNKFHMRTKLFEAGVPVPRFRQVTGLEQAYDVAASLGFPLVIKPVDNMGARGVRRIDTYEELREQFVCSLQFSGHYSSPAVILEEYMEGPEISMDTLVEHDTIHLITVADRHIENPPYFIEMGHTIPSALSKDQIADAFDMMRRAIRAIGIKHGAAKADIKITRDGARIGEITARLSGGFHSQFTEYLATGMNSTRAAVQLAIGERLDHFLITPKWDRVAIERAVVTRPGRIDSIEGVDEALTIPGIERIILNLREGDIVYPLRSNLGKVANIIATGNDREEAEAAVSRAIMQLRINIQDLDSVHTEMV